MCGLKHFQIHKIIFNSGLYMYITIRISCIDQPSAMMTCCYWFNCKFFSQSGSWINQSQLSWYSYIIGQVVRWGFSSLYISTSIHVQKRRILYISVHVFIYLYLHCVNWVAMSPQKNYQLKRVNKLEHHAISNVHI